MATYYDPTGLSRGPAPQFDTRGINQSLSNISGTIDNYSNRLLKEDQLRQQAEQQKAQQSFRDQQLINQANEAKSNALYRTETLGLAKDKAAADLSKQAQSDFTASIIGQVAAQPLEKRQDTLMSLTRGVGGFNPSPQDTVALDKLLTQPKGVTPQYDTFVHKTTGAPLQVVKGAQIPQDYILGSTYNQSLKNKGTGGKDKDKYSPNDVFASGPSAYTIGDLDFFGEGDKNTANTVGTKAQMLFKLPSAKVRTILDNSIDGLVNKSISEDALANQIKAGGYSKNTEVTLPGENKPTRLTPQVTARFLMNPDIELRTDDAGNRIFTDAEGNPYGSTQVKDLLNIKSEKDTTSFWNTINQDYGPTDGRNVPGSSQYINK